MSPEYKAGIWRKGRRCLDWYDIEAEDNVQAIAGAKALAQTLEQPTEILSVININNDKRQIIHQFDKEEESEIKPVSPA